MALSRTGYLPSLFDHDELALFKFDELSLTDADSRILLFGSTAPPEIYLSTVAEEGEILKFEWVDGMNEVECHGLAVDFDDGGVVVTVGRDSSEDEDVILNVDDAMAYSCELVGSDWIVKRTNGADLLLHCY